MSATAVNNETTDDARKLNGYLEQSTTRQSMMSTLVFVVAAMRGLQH